MRENPVQVQTVALVGLSVSLAVLLSFFRVLRLPQGGEVSLEMVPLLVLALLRGARAGAMGGVLYGAIHFIQDPYAVHPLQYLLDYPAAYGALGVAGLFRAGSSRRLFPVLLGVSAACLARFSIHTASGILFFFRSPEWWAASAAYNGAYMAPEWAISLITVPLLLRRLEHRVGAGSPE